MDECTLLSGSVTPTKEDHSLPADEDPLLVPALHHRHQLLRRIVIDVLLVRDGPHRNLRLLFHLLLLFTSMGRVLRDLVLLEVFSLYLLDSIILTIS